MERLCDVRIYEALVASPCCGEELGHGCEKCRVGCFEIARFKNPLYPDGNFFNYAEHLCARHYDEVMDFIQRQDNGTLESWEKYDEN